MGQRTLSVTKLYKYLLVALVFLTIVPIGANAGNKYRSFEPGALKAVLATQSATSFKKRNVKVRRIRLAQSSNQRISPSAALRAAQRAAPGSRGLGVRYDGARRRYVVTLKTRGRKLRVYVDARTGRVRR